MRKYFAIIILITVIVLLCGCTTEADRIYVICRIDNGVVTCYKSDDIFYTVTTEGNLLPSIDPTLQPYPALTFTPTEGDFCFREDIPHLYIGTLRELEHYVYCLLSNGAIDYEIYYSDYKSLEIYVNFPDDVYRILYNIYGEIRIYSQNAIPILYLNGNKNIEK